MRRKGNVFVTETIVSVGRGTEPRKLRSYHKVRKSVAVLTGNIPKEFKSACEKAGIVTTSRQLNKWNRGVGAARKFYAGISSGKSGSGSDAGSGSKSD